MTVQKSHDRTATGQTAGQAELPSSQPKPIKSLPRDHADYWASKLKKRTYSDRQGKVVEVPEWQVRLFHAGKEDWFNLGTGNKAAASVKARDVYVHLRAHGWEPTLARFKPKAQERAVVTVGEFLDEVKAVSGLKPGTFEIYAKKFGTLVAGAFGIESGKERFDYVNGGRESWLNKVHSIRLERLTPDKVNDWKVRRLRTASKNPLQLKRTSTTLRSILLGSKALFSPDIRKHITLHLPSPLPFEGVSLPDAGKHRYKSEIDPAVILTAAKRELAEGIQGEDQPANPRPELFKIVLLALGAGLRRDEIDKLQWKQVLWQRNSIRVETTEHGSTKTSESEQDVDVDPGLLELLKTYMPRPGKGSPFVIKSTIQPRPQSVRTHHYRCNRQFNELIVWLRGRGMTSRNALHSLRKEFGSQICAQAGIFAASTALRHSSINLTHQYYVDKKQPAVFAVSKLLEAPEALVKGSQVTAAALKA